MFLEKLKQALALSDRMEEALTTFANAFFSLIGFSIILGCIYFGYWLASHGCK